MRYEGIQSNNNLIYQGIKMELPVVHNNITYDRLKKSEIDQACQILTKAFMDNEPLVMSLKISYEDIFTLCQTFTVQAFDDHLCLVCKDEHGNVIGAGLARDIATQIDYSQLSAELAPIFTLLEQLLSPSSFNGFKQYSNTIEQAGIGIEGFMVGVESEHMRQGIARYLIDTAMSYMGSLGYRYMIGEATSPITQSICQQYGFEALAKLSYQEFEFEGENIFKSIDFSNWNTPAKLFGEKESGAVLLAKAF